MFAYGQLSDLKDGRLVTPIKKNGNIIECLLQDGSIQSFSFDDFDFDKTIAERIEINIEDDSSTEDETTEDDNPVEDDSSTEELGEYIEINLQNLKYNFKYNDFTFFIKSKEEKNFEWLKKSNKLIFSERVRI